MKENEQKTCSMQPTSPLRYAVGMFGTSIPVNMFKTYAAFFYVDKLGLITTPKFALILFIYTFLDAIDNPVYGFLSDRTRTKWGRRRPWLLIGAPLLVLCFILFFNPPASLAAGSAFSYILLTYMLTGTLDSLINANYGALFPELFPTEDQRHATGVPAHRHDHQHRPDPHHHREDRLRHHRLYLRRIGHCGHLVHGPGLP